jgi:3-hydroxyisobutyrate dehydrogenase
MTRHAFIGLGNMSGGMAASQAKAGREVVAFNLRAATSLGAMAEDLCALVDRLAGAGRDFSAILEMPRGRPQGERHV